MGKIGKTSALALILIVAISPVALLAAESANAQTPMLALEWSKTYSPSTGFSLVQTFDDGYIIAGVNRTGFHDSLSFSTFVIKANSLGEIIWMKQFGDMFAGPLFPISIIQTSDSGYILSTPINRLIKLNSHGDIEWNIQVFGGKIAEVNDGYVVAGFSIDSFGNHFSNITKVDSHGKMLWIKSFDNGFQGNIAFRALSETTDDKLALAGNWGSSFWFGIMDSEGNFLVNRTYPSHGSSNIFSGIANTKDGGFILCGQNGEANAVLYKVDVNGNLEWNNTYSPNAFNSVVQISDNGYLAGTNIGFIVKANANGYQEFIANYSTGVFGIITTSDNGFAATGVLNGRLWLAKFSLDTSDLTSPSPTSPLPTVNTGPHTEPFPTLTVLIVASVFTAVVIVLLFYIKRLKNK